MLFFLRTLGFLCVPFLLFSLCLVVFEKMILSFLSISYKLHPPVPPWQVMHIMHSPNMFFGVSAWHWWQNSVSVFMF